jgi:hypothetical protein
MNSESAPGRAAQALQVVALVASLTSLSLSWRTWTELGGRAAATEGRTAAADPGKPEPRRPPAVSTETEPDPATGPAGADSGPGRPAGRSADPAELARLEKRLKALEESLGLGAEALVIPGVASTPEKVAEAQGTIRDPMADLRARTRALRSLWMGAPEARTWDVTRGLLDVLRAEQDAEMREEILTGLFGVTDPEWRYEFLRRLASDPEPRVRQAAAKVLGPLADDPEVTAALEAASRNDESEKVRKQASTSLQLPTK